MLWVARSTRKTFLHRDHQLRPRCSLLPSSLSSRLPFPLMVGLRLLVGLRVAIAVLALNDLVVLLQALLVVGVLLRKLLLRDGLLLVRSCHLVASLRLLNRIFPMMAMEARSRRRTLMKVQSGRFLKQLVESGAGRRCLGLRLGTRVC